MYSKSWSVWGLLCVLFAGIPVFAQSSGSITGTVVDNSGAVVSGSEVVVSDPSTGFRRSAISNGDGNYLIAGLGAGTYDVTITAKGFQKFEAKRVILRVGEKIRVDTKLVVGKVSSEIVVEGSSVGKVETQSSELA
jgi:hypothetical protein